MVLFCYSLLVSPLGGGARLSASVLFTYERFCAHRRWFLFCYFISSAFLSSSRATRPATTNFFALVFRARPKRKPAARKKKLTQRTSGGVGLGDASGEKENCHLPSSPRHQRCARWLAGEDGMWEHQRPKRKPPARGEDGQVTTEGSCWNCDQWPYEMFCQVLFSPQ